MGKKEKKLVILTGYFKEESYGLLGPQMAATIINDHTDYEAIVVGVKNEDNHQDLKIALNSYFKDQQKIVGFSSLGGRPDLFDLAKELKAEGAVTILAGPQAGPDYKGETDWQTYPHRFQGLSDCFSFALHGPAQQIIPILASGLDSDISKFEGVYCRDDHGQTIETPSLPWDDIYLSKVDWQTLYLLKAEAFEPLTISCAQVLQQIGCQHAAKKRSIFIDYPWGLTKKGSLPSSISICQKGCSFCDVAADKGYMGGLNEAAIKEQLWCLPERPDNRKIPFELINESPLLKLSRIFDLADELSIQLSQINLTLRADYLLSGLKHLEAALAIAQKKDVRILLSSIGFESFDDSILKNLNKGVNRQTNLDAIKALRSLKPKYPAHFGYLKEEGANHGFIHPTPWDNPDISREINKTISMYQLSLDILPNHSTPLIIHHASGLADWIRQIEIKEKIEFVRVGTTIGWWQTKRSIPVMNIISTIVPVFIIIFLGLFAKHKGFIRSEFLNQANRLVYYIAIPAMIFNSISKADLKHQMNLEVIIITLVSVIAITLVAFGAAGGLKMARPSKGTFIQCSFHGNLGYIGLAVAFYYLGNSGFVKAAIIAGFVMILQNLLAVIVLQYHSGKTAGPPKLFDILKKTMANPVILSALAGIFFSLFNLTMPLILDRALEILRGMALPLALLIIGASLSFEKLKPRMFNVLISSFLKVMVTPAIGLVLFKVLSVNPVDYLPGLIILSSPTATLTYIMAKEIGGDPDFAVAGISICTLVSSLTYGLWLSLG